MDHAKTRLGRMLLAAALAVPLPAAAVDDIFLKLDGIRGESTDKAHPGEIEILSYTQAFTGPFSRSAPAAATGAGTGKTTCGAVTLTKFVDLASPDLTLAALNGRHIPTAVIFFRRPGANPIGYYKVILEDVIVADIEQTNTKLNFPNPAPPRAVEKVSLLGRRYRFEYNGTDAAGKAGGQPKAGWDCAVNSKL